MKDGGESKLLFWENNKVVFPNEELKQLYEHANGLYIYPNLETFKE